MGDSSRCPDCGAPLPEAGGACLACLLGAGLDDVDQPPLGRGFIDYLAHSDTVLGQLGEYELLELLGEGGMGRVYKARQASLNRIVALKILRGDRRDRSEFRRRFRQEAELAARLQHPNIVPIFEVGDDEGEMYYSMEWVPGHDLNGVVRQASLPPGETARLLHPLAEAVHYAHQRGVLHRDLKPANILVGEDRRPRITDFGLARAMEEESGLTATGDTLGTPGYLPPEQVEPQRGAVGPRADVYGLGAILYHALTGRPPFSAESVSAILRAVCEQEPVSPRVLRPEVPRDLATICLKCLEKDPQRRYPSAEAVARDLDRFLHDEPIVARPPGPFERLARWAVRHQRTVVPVGALLALLALVLVFFTVRDRSQQTRRALAAADQATSDDLPKNLPRILRLLAPVLARESENRAAAEQMINCLNQAACLVPVGVPFSADVSWADYAAGDSHILVCATNPSATSLEVWTTDGRRLNRLPQTGEIQHAALSRDARWLAVATEDGCQVTELPHAAHPLALFACPSNVYQVLFGIPGLPLARTGVSQTDRGADESEAARRIPSSSGRQELLVVVAESSITTWDTSSWRLNRAFTLPSDTILRFALSPDFNLLAAAGTRSRTIHVWNLATGQTVFRHEGAHGNTMRCLVFNAAGDRLLSTSDDGEAALWDLDHQAGAVRLSHDSAVRWGTFLGHSDLVVTTTSGVVARKQGNGRAVVWSCGKATQGTQLAEFPHDGVAVGWVGGAEDGDTFTTLAADHVLRFWSVQAKRKIGEAPPSLKLAAYFPPITTPSVRRDGSHLLAILENRTAIQMRWIGGRPWISRPEPGADSDATREIPSSDLSSVPIRDIESSLGVMLGAWDLSPDGQTLAVVENPNRLRLLHPANFAVLASPSFPSPPQRLNTVCFSPDGRHLAASAPSGLVGVWHWDRVRRILQPVLRTQLPVGLESIGFTPDGRSLRATFRSEADLQFPVASVDGPVPPWLIDLARALAPTSEGAPPSTTTSFDEVRQHILALPLSGTKSDQELTRWARNLIQ